MATFKEGNFSINLGLVKLDGRLTDDDRQCAWELYAEIITRVAVVGKWSDKEAASFEGEIYAESFTSLYRFFQEARSIMRKFPVGRIEKPTKDHLGVMIQRILTDALRPFLEKWQGNYRSWWDLQMKKPDHRNPFEVQKDFENLKSMLEDWSSIRRIMRHAAHEICDAYQLEPVIQPPATNARPAKPVVI